ncbi:DUF202 domain-containing protein [Pseudonocardia sp.]|uniref:DUF202 domain-containing protein n=1 Tax=Pseudonocardia sp. TaxID=60912 RepID=UPI003D109A81
MRTGLALVAGAVALQSLASRLGPEPVRIGLTVVPLALATIVTTGAYRRWDRAERALRHDQPLPIGALPGILTTGASIVIVGAALLILLANSR